MRPRFTTAPTAAEIEDIADAAFASIPVELRRYVSNVLIRVEEFCDAEIEEEMGLETPFDLLGLYSGVALTQKSVLDASGQLDTIHLYRRPILDYWCETGEDLTAIVRHVLIHEIGHHFGLSDEDMERIENQD